MILHAKDSINHKANQGEPVWQGHQNIVMKYHAIYIFLFSKILIFTASEYVFLMFCQIFLSPQLNGSWLLVINMVYTSCLTSCRLTILGN